MMKKILPLFAIFVAAVVLMSSGAFTSVTASRTATINVVGDSSALLGLEAGTSSLVHETSGKLVIDFSAIDASGVNMDATTVVSNAFTITNNGASTVTVTLAKVGTNPTKVSFGDIESGVSLASGASTTVSFTITSTGLASGANILSSITLTAVVPE